jgi:hypothetical protein
LLTALHLYTSKNLKTVIKELFLYYYLCLSVKLDSLSYTCTSISCLANWDNRHNSLCLDKFNFVIINFPHLDSYIHQPTDNYNSFRWVLDSSLAFWTQHLFTKNNKEWTSRTPDFLFGTRQTPPSLLKPEQWRVKYMCLRGIYFVSGSTIFRLDIGPVLTMLYFFLINKIIHFSL